MTHGLRGQYPTIHDSMYLDETTTLPKPKEKKKKKRKLPRPKGHKTVREHVSSKKEEETKHTRKKRKQRMLIHSCMNGARHDHQEEKGKDAEEENP